MSRQPTGSRRRPLTDVDAERKRGGGNAPRASAIHQVPLTHGAIGAIDADESLLLAIGYSSAVSLQESLESNDVLR